MSQKFSKNSIFLPKQTQIGGRNQGNKNSPKTRRGRQVTIRTQKKFIRKTQVSAMIKKLNEQKNPTASNRTHSIFNDLLKQVRKFARLLNSNILGQLKAKKTLSISYLIQLIETGKSTLINLQAKQIQLVETLRSTLIKLITIIPPSNQDEQISNLFELLEIEISQPKQIQLVETNRSTLLKMIVVTTPSTQDEQISNSSELMEIEIHTMANQQDEDRIFANNAAVEQRGIAVIQSVIPIVHPAQNNFIQVDLEKPLQY